MSAAYGTSPARKVRFEWIGESWQLFTAQCGAWIISVLIFGLISIAIMYALEFIIMFRYMFSFMATPGTPPDPTTMMKSMMPMIWVFSIAVGIVFALLNAFFGGGLLKMANKQVRGFPIAIGDLFSGRSVFIPLAACELIFYLPYYLINLAITYPMIDRAFSSMTNPGLYFTSLGAVWGTSLVLGLIPIALLGLFWPAAALIADDETVGSALAKSWNAMKGAWFMAVLFMITFLLVMWISALCIFTLLITIPMFVIISSLMYRDMVGMPQREPPPMAGYYYQEPQPRGAWPPPPSQSPPGGPEGWPAPSPPDSGTPPTAPGGTA